MPVTLARSMDAVSICTCSLPTASLPRHLPLTLSALPRTASPAPRLRAPRPPLSVLLPACSRFPRPAGGVRPGEPSRGHRGAQSLNAAGEPSGRDLPAPENRTLPVRAGVCSGERREHPALKAPQTPGVLAPAGNTVWHSAPWLVSLQYQFFIFTRPKKPVTKPNKHTHPIS